MGRGTKSILVMVALAVSLASIIIVIGRSSNRTSAPQKNDILQRVKQSPDIAINFNNFDGVPIIIQKAVTKEISASEYQKLTGGESSTADRFATFPSITLLNSANQRIAKLMVMAGNRQTKKWYVVTFREANIAPQQIFSMTSADWRPDKPANGVSASPTPATSKAIDFDLPRMWWPGGAKATDLVFRIGMVEFEDGKKWEVDEARGSLW